MFEIKEKVVLITGGVSGIGFQTALELLRSGVKGVTLADINIKAAEKAIKEIENEFGKGKAIFVKVDVTRGDEVETAFVKTIEKFNRIDILINCAGILNEKNWERQIEINMKGVINTIMVGMKKYLAKYHQGKEAVILNVSSLGGILGLHQYPVYVGSKHAVIGFTKSWGQQHVFKKTKVRIVAVCPGVTRTPLLFATMGETIPDDVSNPTGDRRFAAQEPSQVAREIKEVIKYAPNGTIWVIEGGEPAFQYIFPPIEAMKENVLSKL